jgi:hypothetical protein
LEALLHLICITQDLFPKDADALQDLEGLDPKNLFNNLKELDPLRKLRYESAYGGRF